VHDIAALLKDWPQAEYNIEGNPFHNLMDFVRELADKPAAGHLRARQRGPVHLDHGWDLAPTVSACAR
jgi:pyridoxine 5-phosphate synthase